MNAVEEIVEEHPLGGLTRAEALKVFDVGNLPGACTDEELEAVKEIGRRVAAELLLLERAEEYGGVLEYVKESEGFISEPQGEELAYALENTLDRLERGDSEAMEFFAEWRKAQKWKKRRKKKDLLMLAEAADHWLDELEHQLETGDMIRSDRSRMTREAKQLKPVVARVWKKVQS